MDYKKYKSIMKKVPETEVSDAVWIRINHTLNAPTRNQTSLWTIFFKPLYLIPILTPALIVIGLFWMSYVTRQSDYQRMLMFSQSTEYIYTICKY